MTTAPAIGQPAAETAPGLVTDNSVFEVLPYQYQDGVFLGSYRGVVLGHTRTFTERIDFTAAGGTARPSEALLRLLALTVSLSYFKATLANAVAVDFPLSTAELTFFRTLAEHGLGEYAFVNQAEWKLTPSVTAPDATQRDTPAPVELGLRPVVAVGGGKDSIVTIEALKASGRTPLLFSVNDRGAIKASVAASGLPYLTIARTIDPALIECNREGAPNGHVPVTAINSVIGLITAELTGSGPVIFSNEESADYGNLVWHGRTINHQWSKSLAYEDLLRSTLAAEGLQPDRFFSLLRGYRELEIARDFARHPAYFDAFTSCNRAYRIAEADRSAGWCGACPKCAFVFVLLAPYISRDRLTEIFGRDMLDEPEQRERMTDILGLGSQKPFECVGEPSEAVEAIALVAEGGQWRDAALLPELVAALPAMSAPARLDRAAGTDRVPAAYRDARDRIGLA